MQWLSRLSTCAALLVVVGCSRGPEGQQPSESAERSEAAPANTASAAKSSGEAESRHEGKRDEEHGEKHEEEHSDAIALTAEQIKAAGIDIAPVRRGFAGAIDAPAVIVADPQHASVVSSTVGGRVVEATRNLGETVARGDTLAVIESREVAQFGADAAISRRQRELAEANFQREERLYAEKVSSRQEYEVAKAAYDEARSRQRLAEQQVASAGGRTDQAGRLLLRAPISGVITARQVARGDVIEAQAKLFEIADLNTLSVELSLTQADAARVSVGTAIDVTADGRSSTGKITYLSRVLDPATRQVRAIALLPNPQARWRIGETVRAAIALGTDGAGQLAVPRTAVQTVEDKPSVFVRDKNGFSVRPIVLGQSAGTYVTVQSGLHGDEQIAVSNTYILKAELGKGEAGEDHD
ncbi:efflux RND transporter periplasmic adaptor subunit [Pseudoduganella umbonata]|uniref:Cobalt-zinc-cadmium efflux system membrane fusion protein n=1 Tax=Pseudoduganella umbonata TaxID=864828 RepID=A0A4P8HU97_9BURK|nr:efflux RND transporter periplasmic adaptor subunit [Pseudoduganella umbonata]MBB3222102.1 cobalt-zinc-cadmium efflux system membrane fusion protein [Pseudoduganella umbonata]QCP12342.1 efflux RND transporter periplasmic adaptor subunit [Pseudoduganella umbonata]